MKKKYLEAGKIVATHGIRGELKVYPWTDSPSVLCGIKCFYLDENGKHALDTESAREHKNMALIKFKKYDDIDKSRELLERVIYIDREDIGVDDDSYFIVDLIGLKVVDDEDEKIVYGTVTDITNTGAHDIYTIEMPNGKTGMIPAVAEMIKSVDIEAGIIKARPAKGLLGDF